VAEHSDERILRIEGAGAHVSKASLRDGVVYRRAGPWSAAVVALLRHFEALGFSGAPRVVGSGFAEDGREMVSFIPGESPQPFAWDDASVGHVGELLRAAHDAAASFVVPPDARWREWFGRGLPTTRSVIGHCDLGPWNVIGQHGVPVAFIDWEFAGPVDAVWDLAQAIWLNAQLHDDDIAERVGLPDAANRVGQVRSMIDGYGLEKRDRVDFVDRLIAMAIHSARAEAIQYDVTPSTTAALSSSGFPVLWGIAWRARSASWLVSNRALLDRAITRRG
jgi:Ser/Thr protein kinase RdoA (MazF antagonist)